MIYRLPNKFAVALAVAISLAGAAVTQANCTVPGTHASIDAAANDPTCSIIDVAAGVYNQNITVTHSCEIRGARAGTAVSGRVSGGPDESIAYGSTAGLAAFTISATDVT